MTTERRRPGAVNDLIREAKAEAWATAWSAAWSPGASSPAEVAPGQDGEQP